VVVFEYTIHVKVSRTINLCVKINSRIKSYKSQFQIESILKAESILIDNNQTCHNQLWSL